MIAFLCHHIYTSYKLLNMVQFLLTLLVCILLLFVGDHNKLQFSEQYAFCSPLKITIFQLPQLKLSHHRNHVILTCNSTSLTGMLHLVYGMNFSLISASPVRHSLLRFLLSHMAFHHLYLHYHRLHLLLLAQYFILNSRLGSSANPFLHRPFPFLPD